MSDAVETYLDEDFAALEDVSFRELEATAAALERRRDGLGRFSGIFRGVAAAREGGRDPSLERFHLKQAISRPGDDLAERIANAEAPFWRIVRKAARELGHVSP